LDACIGAAKNGATVIVGGGGMSEVFLAVFRVLI
jgi:hypothetical protein